MLLTEKVDDRVYTLEDVKQRTLDNPDQMSVYIAGPMTGRAKFNYPAFDALELALERRGYIVASPARLDSAETRRVALQSVDGAPGSGTTNGETWGDFLARDVKMIADTVDAVVLMPGWETSKGARLEAFIARHVGKPVFYNVTWEWQHSNPDAAHADICLCKLLPDDEYGIDFIEVDDAELDHVLTTSDVEVLLKLERDNAKPQVSAESEAFVTAPEAIRREARRLDEMIQAYQESEPKVKITSLNGKPDYLPGKEVRVTDPATGGQKGSKNARYDLIPAWPLDQLAKVYGGGAQKYDDNNWRKGYNWGLSVAALQRHLSAWLQGEDCDPEVSELAGEPVNHLANVMWHCCTLMTFQHEGLGTNDLADRPDREDTA